MKVIELSELTLDLGLWGSYTKGIRVLVVEASKGLKVVQDIVFLTQD